MHTVWKTSAVLLLALVAAQAAAQDKSAIPATMRIDLVHSGDAQADTYALDRVVLEPLPWPGNTQRPLDDSNRGMHKFEVVDPRNGKLLYSRGYSSVFDEWRTTAEAGKLRRAFGESLRFPRPAGPVQIRLYMRGADNAFVPEWTLDIDPDALDVVQEKRPAPVPVIPIVRNGEPSDKVELLILGDGYTTAQMDKFDADARRLIAHLFTVSPFRERAADFNVWAMAMPTAQAGVSRPSTGIHHASALGARYDIFGSERYVLTLDNRALRELAQYAPNEFIEILVNNDTYGGGGIFGQFSTAAASNDWANYLFVHEFGHHFAGLADEYYTSPVAYQSRQERPEPWEPNATALHDPAALKWKSRLTPGVPLPTPWPKAKFETFQRESQAKRAKVREQHRPEQEMSKLFEDERHFTRQLVSNARYRDVVGAFEGANYQASGYYRPQMQCIMFDRSERFCPVCQDAVDTIINLYAQPAPH